LQVELKETEPLHPNPAENPLSRIKIVMEAESRQDISEGLKFFFVFSNIGDKTVEFQNPHDGIHLSLHDEEGWPVRFPGRRSSARINTRERPGPHPNAPVIQKLEPGQQYATGLVVRHRVADGPTTIDLAPGKYKATAKVLLLAADPNLDREHAYRVLTSDEIVIEFGPA
jgi:hypothetical protein